MGSEFASKSQEPAQQKSSPPPTKTVGPLSSTHPVLQLQRTLGNQGVLRLIQSRQLGVSQPGDKHEREVDRVDEQVMRMPEPQVQRPLEEEEELQLKANPAVLQRQEMEEEEPLQGRFTTSETPIQLQGDRGGAENRTGVPGRLKAGLEALSGMDLSGVRVHYNASKPAQLNALAYTQGQDIHVGPGQEKHLPHEGWHVVQQMQGRVKPSMQAKGVSINDDAGLEREADVLGTKALQMTPAEHELTHVVQQSNRAPAGARGAKGPSTIQRQSATQSAASQPPQPQVIAPNQQSQWVRVVDDDVRQEFGLRGPRMTPGRVRFLGPSQFAANFPGSAIEEKLLELFLSPAGNIHSILRAHNIALASPARLRRFVRQRIAAGFFNESFVDPIRRVMVTRQITPRDLLAQHVGGITDVAPSARARRRVNMQTNQHVETLVHEACHFYVSNAFKRFAASVPNRGHLRRGAGIEHTLMEGYAERFARQVMRNNAANLGPMGSQAYPFQVHEVWRYSLTIGSSDAEDAYFRGNATALANLGSALQKYETTHPDLIEPWP